MTKRGIITIAALVVIAVAVVLFFVLRDRPDAVEPVPTYTIALDAGHGGSDGGASPDGVMEKDIVLEIAKLALEIAEAEPTLDPVLIRSLDILIPLEERIEQAEEAGAILYVTIHANSYSGPDPHGVETLVADTRELGDDSWTLAELIQDAVVSETGARDRGTRSQESYTERTEVPAVSVETGFVTNPDELANLLDPEYQARIATGIVNGIKQFIGLRYPPDESEE